jgi:hypothetical protein
MATAIPPRAPSRYRRSAALGALALLLLSGGGADVLHAQWSVDLGGLAVAYDGVNTLGGGRVGPQWRFNGSTLYVEAGGSAAQFDDATWSADGGGLVAWRPTRIVGLDPELIAAGGIAGAKGSDLSSQIGGTARMHRVVGALDLFGGAGGGRTDGVLGARTYTMAELGATYGRGVHSATLATSPTWTEGARYTDLSLYVRREGRLTLEAMLGGRRLTAPTEDTESWLGASAEWGLGGRLSILATGGTFPSDPSGGFPGGRYFTLGLRLGQHSRNALRPSRTTPITRPLPWPDATFEVRDRGEGIREIIVNAPAATAVEITGDFTDWEPLALTKESGRWRVRIALPAGVHRVNLRLDGGAWLIPPGIPRVLDEFGTEAGLLVVD